MSHYSWSTHLVICVLSIVLENYSVEVLEFVFNSCVLVHHESMPQFTTPYGGFFNFLIYNFFVFGKYLPKVTCNLVKLFYFKD